MSTFHTMAQRFRHHRAQGGRCIAMLALLVAAQGVVNAQNDARWSWREPQAKVLPTGDLEWAPRAFEFKAGESIRYIDFEAGNDANDGCSKQTSWKHHPGDPQAGGKAAACKGVQTYVFKQGVNYRGEIDVNESGTADAPIILTREPSWGEGPAVICGSEVVTGWKKGADNNLIPEPEKVWHVDLGWMPRNVWMTRKDGAVTRIALARTPNWKVSNPDDVKSEWWEWNNPDRPFDNYVTTASGRKLNLGIDTKHLTQPASYYRGATVWTEYGWVMGTPYPTPVEVVDTEKHALGFTGQWGDTPGSFQFIRYCRYFLEDKPQYLDSPGEFWFEKKGDGGRLYIRLPDDQNPNSAHVEVARRIHMIESSGMSHVHISGLTFRFPNVYNLTVAPYWVNHVSIDVDPGCVRLLGSGTDIHITNCVFEHVHQAIRLKATGRQDAIGDVVVSDNVIRYTDNGALYIADSTTYGDVAPPMGRLYDVKVLRNRFYETGIRPNRFDQGHALDVDYAQTLEVAGNILDRCWGAGIFVFGGKPSGAITDRPFSRMIVHHNKVTDSLLNTCDWGGIETWQGGPSYVYDNISGNPGGYLRWGHMLSPKEPGSARFGHAYYLDGGFKNYHFNNIAWGKSKDPLSPLGNTAAIQEIISYQNTFFNNTFSNFVVGSRRQAPQAGRDKFLGNIWDGIGSWVFRHADPARTAAAGNAADAGPRRGHYDIASDAYAQNIFHDLSNGFGVLEPSGRWLDKLGAFREVLRKNHALASEPGILTDHSPLRDAAAHDFRPAPGSPALLHGVKVFVPWSLYGEVAEWNFYRDPGDPTHLIDEHWNMAPYYVERDGYYTRPTYPLKAVNATAGDYESGPLESWTEGALRFNGRNQYAVLSNKDINRTVDYNVSYQPPDWVTITYPKAMTVGQDCEVQLRLHDVKDGLKLHCDLNWSKKSEEFGGTNTWGGPPREVKGPGPYKFSLVPQDKPDLGSFVLTIYLSTTGDWKDRTLLATVSVPVGAAEGQTRTVTVGGERVVEKRTVTGADLTSPQISTSNFLIESYFRTAPGGKDGTLIQKMNGTGYSLRVNEAGGVTLAAQAAEARASLASHGAVNDGQWHHVIAEADRKARTFTIDIDGKQDASGPGLGPVASLANDADLYVGGTLQGHNLNGAIDFLRIARGTLADAKTTIDELYAWEFHGPFLHDFTGRERPASGGDAGAIDDDAPGHARVATYIVDQAASGAADTNPGTEERPFKTVQHAADAARPGDTVYIMAGQYDERVRVKAGGTEGKPIAFVAMPRRSATVRGFDLEASYIRVQGFEITADKPATAVQLHASHCAILDNFIHHMMVAVNGEVGKPSPDGATRDYSAVAHNRIAYNKIYHSEYGFVLGGEDWLVENNEVSRLFMYAPGHTYDDCDYSRFFGKGCVQRYNYYHGTRTSESKNAHVDCIQTFMNNGGMAQDLIFEFNTCFDWGQGAMVESAPHIGSVRNWTWRHNIYSSRLPTYKGAWGLDVIQTPDVTIENNTFAGIAWCGVGLRGKESTNGQIRNNLFSDAERAIIDGDRDFTSANPVSEFNLTFATWPAPGAKNINGKDPLFVDAASRNFRLRKSSPAIGAGKGGVTIGALDYPNVFYVDPRHPAAADEPAWGYPGVPLATLARACAIAQPGETIVLRGGVYREVLAPARDGVTVRAMKGESVTISGADLIEGWKRETDGAWSAPLAAEPKQVLRDGQPWDEFRYDKAPRRIALKAGSDPRLHVFETVVREQGINLAGKKDVKVVDITVANTLK